MHFVKLWTVSENGRKGRSWDKILCCETAFKQQSVNYIAIKS